MAGPCGEEELDLLLRRIEESMLRILWRPLTLPSVATVSTVLLQSIGSNLGMATGADTLPILSLSCMGITIHSMHFC